jgi:pyrimidine-specific ribonucleoside hydrolase/non-specific riboncleoside hydrolase
MNKRPFLIDCDTGTDDAIAILAALYSPQIDVKAITSVNGNVAEKYTSQNNLNLVEYLGKSIPVAHGAVRPLLGGVLDTEGAPDTHGKTGLGTIELPTASRTQFDPRVADQLIYETAVECKGELELLVVGPMTNIAIALCNHGDLAGLIKHIWFMGGACQGGNVLPTAEFNIWADALAGHIVTQSGIPMTMVGLDVTLKAVMTEEDIAQLRGVGTKACTLAADLLDFMVRRRDAGGEDLVMHDALALGAALCPECLTCVDAFVDVEYSGTYTMGHTFSDAGRRFPAGKPNASVALDIDVPMFRKWLVETISRSKVEE